jgi:glucose/arabinose dehydrogenase
MTTVRALAKFGVVAALALGASGLSGCEAAPTLHVATIVSGLDIPWDVTFAKDGRMFFTERSGGIQLRNPKGGTIRTLQADLSDLWVSGETGLMGIQVDPAFDDNHRIYTCQGHQAGSSHDVRVVPWVLTSGQRALVRHPAIVTGIPTTSGRHGGCRLRIGVDHTLWIGTGDAATGTNPQDLTSLGGKVLRVDRFTGEGVDANPFASSPNANTRRILSYGHRNVQGLAKRPADGKMWTVEHGTDRDDEINRGRRGNFGWDPVPGYDESTPMTDTTKFPNAIPAAWSSGFPTIATSGATWLSGPQWGAWDDHLAVAALKDESLRIFAPSSDGQRLTLVATLFKGQFGRLRTAQLGRDGALYLTTSDGGGTDRILKVSPG